MALTPKPRDRRPAPVLLLIVGLPAATLVAGVATLRVAGSDGLDVVGDPVRRIAQVQVVDHGPDQAARAAGLSALARRTGGRLEVRLDGTDAPYLDLRLEHPLDAARDRRLRLVREDAGRFTAPWPDEAVVWHLALSPPANHWRLVGRWPQEGEGPIPLQPALAGP